LRRLALLLSLALVALPWSAAAKRTHYDVDYVVGFAPAEGLAAVTITVKPHDGRLVSLRLRMAAKRYVDVTGDGSVEREGDHVLWKPPAAGGALHYRYRVDHERRGGGFDARITPDWVILRGDDLVPPAAIVTTKGADSRARLRFELPKGWTNVDTPYLLARNGHEFVVVDPKRRFDRPVGWMIAGAVGTRREFLVGTELSVAGPKGDDVRRNDILAFANLTLPEFKRAFGVMPRKLLIVSADDPMWRGGLSGPRSLFLHADRPLISENGTSSLTHELTHVITRIRGAGEDDWIAEGIAEYYSIELPRRCGLLSASRYQKALEWMGDFGKNVDSLLTRRASGRVTARAVLLLHRLDQEIAEKSEGEKSLDDVVRALIPVHTVSREDLRRLVAELIGGPSQVLASPLLGPAIAAPTP
jgi:hypothetical protein